MPTWPRPSRCDASMTIALLIALAGSLVAMGFIVKKLEQR